MTSERLKNLGIRTGSALAAVGILISTYLFLELTGIIMLGLALEGLIIKEGVNLIDWSPFGKRFKVCFGLFLYTLFLVILFNEAYRFEILMLAITIGLALSINLKVGESLQVLQNIQSRALTATLYLTLFPALLLDLLFKYQGALWFLSLLIMVFAGDVGAYAFGITLGKRPMLPSISPKKTWEGAIGGFSATVLSAYIIHQVAVLKIPLFGWLAMAALISVVAQSGDFFESLLKRISNVKDSGTLMPGHGGILDRIDGLLFAAPIMSIGLSYFDRWI
jgi:phosphatidate cytidylyltransferase